MQVMALPYGDDGVVEVGCNLQATAEKPSQPTDAVLACVRARLPTGASIAHSYVVGMRPAEALKAPPWNSMTRAGNLLREIENFACN